MDEDRKDMPDGYFPPGTKHEDETYEMNGLHFVWDKAKNEANIKKHGIDFKTAALVFNDDYCLIDEDYEHSEKGRTYKRPGISPARAAMAQTKTALTPGQPGTDENPIIRNGIPYVYSSTGKLVRRLDFDPETMEIFVLTPKSVLTDEQITMLKKAMEMPVVYDEDCPKSTPEQLEKFRQYGLARNKKRKEQLTAM